MLFDNEGEEAFKKASLEEHYYAFLSSLKFTCLRGGYSALKLRLVDGNFI